MSRACQWPDCTARHRIVPVTTALQVRQVCREHVLAVVVADGLMSVELDEVG